MSKLLVLGCTAAIYASLMTACTTTPKTKEERDTLDQSAKWAIAYFQREDPGLKAYFDGAAGYAVFPSCGKGAAGIGGAYGHGELFQGGKFVGYCDMTQTTIGFSLGGQAFAEVIFFEGKDALNRFKLGKFAFTAQAAAVALKSGASADAKYTDGVMVFTATDGGLMFEAALGGQKFNYEGN